MRPRARACYVGYRFPVEIISHAVRRYFRLPLDRRMVEELLAAGGIIVSPETVRQWARKFGEPFANQIRRRLPRVGDKWHFDEGRAQNRRCGPGCGEPSTRPVSFSMSRSNADATSGRPNGCCAS